MALIEYPTKLHEAAAKAETSTVASLINGDSIKEVDSLNQARATCRDRPRTPRLPLALSRRLDAGVGVRLSLARRPRLDLLGQQLVRQVLSVA